MINKTISGRTTPSAGYQAINKLTPIADFLRVGVVGLGLAHGVSQAATIEVTSNLDNGTGCTLREVVESITAPSP